MSHLAKLQVEGVRELTLDEMSSVSGGGLLGLGDVSGGGLLGDVSGTLDKGFTLGEEVAGDVTDIASSTGVGLGILVNELIQDIGRVTRNLSIP